MATENGLPLTLLTNKSLKLLKVILEPRGWAEGIKVCGIARARPGTPDADSRETLLFWYQVVLYLTCEEDNAFKGRWALSMPVTPGAYSAV